MKNDPSYNTPGQLIRELLKVRGWTQRVLAIVLNINETTLNHLVADRRPLNAEIALALGEVFGVDPEKFLDLQQSYDLAKARLITRSDPERVTRAHLFGELPIPEMIKRGWLDVDDMRDLPRVEAALTHFFKADSPREIEILPHSAKKTNVSVETTAVQLAWLYRVREIAAEMIVGRYSPKAVRNAIEELQNLLESAEEIRKVPRILAESGIRYAIVESLTGAKIDGVCFWLNDSAPVIAMTLRYDRIDNFWFVLRHEIEHVLRLDGKTTIMLDAELEGERAGGGDAIPIEERAANAAAANFCVPISRLESFMARKGPFFTERNIIAFAQTLHIHPGLVAGQLQYRTNKFNKFREHLVKVKHIISPSAIVDGWGDITPIEA